METAKLKSFFVGFLLFALLLPGCSTPGRAILLGAGIGSVAGMGVGLMAPAGRRDQYRSTNLILGGILGGLLGAGTGFVTNELVTKSGAEAFDRGKAETQKTSTSYVGGAGQPTLVPPRVEARFIDEQVRGTTLVPAHVEYVIVEPAKWIR